MLTRHRNPLTLLALTRLEIRVGHKATIVHRVQAGNREEHSGTILRFDSALPPEFGWSRYGTDIGNPLTIADFRPFSRTRNGAAIEPNNIPACCCFGAVFSDHEDASLPRMGGNSPRKNGSQPFLSSPQQTVRVCGSRMFRSSPSGNFNQIPAFIRRSLLLFRRPFTNVCLRLAIFLFISLRINLSLFLSSSPSFSRSPSITPSLFPRLSHSLLLSLFAKDDRKVTKLPGERFRSLTKFDDGNTARQSKQMVSHTKAAGILLH